MIDLKVSSRDHGDRLRSKVLLHNDEPILRVMMSNTAGGYSPVAERSDGLRAFVALTSFTAAGADSERKPILLVDEAESHLHYDAKLILFVSSPDRKLLRK